MSQPGMGSNGVCDVLVIAFVGDESAEQGSHSLAEVPPSAKLVYKTLEYEGPLTQSGISEESLLPSRTVRSAITALEESELVTDEVYLPDARKRLYRLTSG